MAVKEIRWTLCKRGHDSWKLNKRGQRVCHDCEVLREAKSGAYKAKTAIPILVAELDRQIADSAHAVSLLEEKIDDLKAERELLLIVARKKEKK